MLASEVLKARLRAEYLKFLLKGFCFNKTSVDFTVGLPGDLMKEIPLWLNNIFKLSFVHGIRE